MLVLVVVNAVYSEELIQHLFVTLVYMLYTCDFHRLPSNPMLQPTFSTDGTQDFQVPFLSLGISYVFLHLFPLQPRLKHNGSFAEIFSPGSSTFCLLRCRWEEHRIIGETSTHADT